MKLSEDKLRDYFFDRCTPAEAEQVQSLLAEGEGSEDVDRTMRVILDDMEGRVDVDIEQAREAFLLFRKAVEHRRSFRLRSAVRAAGRWVVRVAAMLALPLGVAVAWLLSQTSVEPPVQWIDLSVPEGTQQVLELSDGTVLNLNAGSRVIYPDHFGGADRRVFFSGELFADVAKDPEHPFVISVGDMSVEVFGTRFNFRAYDNAENIEVALVEGSVMFKPSELEGALLTPGELIQYNRDTHSLIRDTFDPEGYMCPAMGTGFIFNNLPLKDIVVQLEHSFNVSIVVDSPGLLTHNYTAYFSNGETIDEILSKINDSGSGLMRIRRDGRVIHVTAADKPINKNH